MIKGLKRSRFYPIRPGGEMADTPDLGSGAVRRVGSSPILGKKIASLREAIFLSRKQGNCLPCVRTRSEAPCVARTGFRDGTAELPARKESYSWY